MPRFDAEWIDFMLRPERRGSPEADEILDLIGVSPGQVIADVGCGPGFFTLAAATRIGHFGRVYAVDLEPTMLDLVQARAAEAGLRNVVTFRVTGAALPLDDRSVDLTICGLVLHDLRDPEQMVDELNRITRPGGVIAITEWTVESDFKRPNRVPPADLTRLLVGVGRTPGPPIALPPKQYLMLA